MLKKILFLTILFAGFLISGKSRAQNEAMEEFASQIEDAVNESDTETLDAVFDKESFIQKVIGTIGRSAGSEEFTDGMIKGLEDKLNLSTMLMSVSGEEGGYQFLRYFRDDAGLDHMLFRVYVSGNLNYHDMEVSSEKGPFLVNDIYVFASGEKLSETFRNLFASMITGYIQDKDNKDNFEKIIRMRKYYQEKNYERMIDSYQSLSEYYQKQKTIMLLYVQACGSHDNEDLYQNALRNYRHFFPKDPSLNLIMIDYFFLRKEYENAMDNINNLDLAVGGDLFLDFYRGILYNAQEDRKNAEKHFRRLMNNFPERTEGYDNLMEVYAANEDPKKFVDVLNKLADNYEADKELIAEAVKENYPKMAKSELFLAWLKE